MPSKWVSGACHCRTVQFEAFLPPQVELENCNCSICAKSGYLHAIVPAAHFKLKAGSNHLLVYRFNTQTAEHLFCATCGVKPFYRPRSNPDGFSVNFRCLDDGHSIAATVVAFDGLNWEQNAASLVLKSKG